MINRNKAIAYLLFLLILLTLFTACTRTPIYGNDYRLAAIPEDAVKILPADDLFPPIMHSDEFGKPVPVEVISTPGAEDSAFIPADRDELYFMFVKDVREEPGVQVQDRVNGIWVSKKVDGEWAEPELVLLQKENELALNGAEFVFGDEMIFVSARENYEGLNWFRAIELNGVWSKWRQIEFEPAYEVGELHIHQNTMYFHSYMDGGKGDMDIWAAEIDGNRLFNLRNIENVNSSGLEGWPYISPDGNELWFTGNHQGTAAVFRSMKTNGGWGMPELIVSRFAGEPTLDRDGNLYFTHHYFREGIMLEADIYVAYRIN